MPPPPNATVELLAAPAGTASSRAGLGRGQSAPTSCSAGRAPSTAGSAGRSWLRSGVPGGARRPDARGGVEESVFPLCRVGGLWYDWPTVRVPQHGCHALRGDTAPRYRLPPASKQPPDAASGRRRGVRGGASCAASVGRGLGTPTVRVPGAALHAFRGRVPEPGISRRGSARATARRNRYPLLAIIAIRQAERSS
jgi:hypothetical protein